MASKSKTIQLSWTIGQADRNRKIAQAIEFLHKGLVVQIEFRLKGREVQHLNQMVARAGDQLKEILAVDPAFVLSSQHTSSHMHTIILRKKGMQ
jgi:translation initiation factor IF-3